jgi:polyhydroxybutyrate depolymerase
MRSAFPLLALGLLAIGETCLAQDVGSLGPGDFTRTPSVEGLQHRYLVHIPATYDPKQPTPVVIAFHGGGVDAEHMVTFSGLNEKSDEAGFIVVYPYGTGRLRKILTFNAGDCCGYAARTKTDDVAFTRHLLDDLARLVNVDTKRVYATGMSNGAMMAYRLASEVSPFVAATARGSPTRISIRSSSLSVIGWKRTVASGNRPSRRFPTMPRMEPPSFARPTVAAGTGRKLSWSSSTVAVTPGRDGKRARVLGKSTKNISATDMMWEFFVKHPMP